MARFRTLSLDAYPLQVFDAALEAAAQMGLEVSTADREAGSLLLSACPGRLGSRHRFVLSVTDNGLGGSTVHISWDDRFPGLARGFHRRTAAGLCERLQHLVR